MRTKGRLFPSDPIYFSLMFPFQLRQNFGRVRNLGYLKVSLRISSRVSPWSRIYTLVGGVMGRTRGASVAVGQMLPVPRYLLPVVVTLVMATTLFCSDHRIYPHGYL